MTGIGAEQNRKGTLQILIKAILLQHTTYKSSNKLVLYIIKYSKTVMKSTDIYFPKK